MVITAQDALNIQKRNKTSERLAYEMMVDRIETAIRTSSEQDRSLTRIKIPSYMWGLPDFDRSEVQRELIYTFRKQGFSIFKCDDGFTISWGDPERSYPPPSIADDGDAIRERDFNGSHRHSLYKPIQRRSSQILNRRPSFDRIERMLDDVMRDEDDDGVMGERILDPQCNPQCNPRENPRDKPQVQHLREELQDELRDDPQDQQLQDDLAPRDGLDGEGLRNSGSCADGGGTSRVSGSCEVDEGPPADNDGEGALDSSLWRDQVYESNYELDGDGSNRRGSDQGEKHIVTIVSAPPPAAGVIKESLGREIHGRASIVRVLKKSS